jgi:segregation and condensation protein B
VTQLFLDHFGMESAKDLPGIKELRDAGLLDNRPPPGATLDISDNEFIENEDQEDMFE